MITDPATLADVRQTWSAVKKLSSEGLYSRATSSGWVQVNRPDDSFNLPLVLAYACLDQVLGELRDEGVFSCRWWHLGEKMEASRCVLPWQDYDEVFDGKEKRNRIAHEATLLPKSECLQYIVAIEQELNAWNIL